MLRGAVEEEKGFFMMCHGNVMKLHCKHGLKANCMRGKPHMPMQHPSPMHFILLAENKTCAEDLVNLVNPPDLLDASQDFLAAGWTKIILPPVSSLAHLHVPCIFFILHFSTLINSHDQHHEEHQKCFSFAFSCFFSHNVKWSDPVTFSHFFSHNVK